jgi:hypothetical protein
MNFTMLNCLSGVFDTIFYYDVSSLHTLLLRTLLLWFGLQMLLRGVDKERLNFLG